MTYYILVGVMVLLLAAAIANIRGLKRLRNLIHLFVIGLSISTLVCTIVITKDLLEIALFVGVIALAAYLWYDANKYDESRAELGLLEAERVAHPLRTTSGREVPVVGELFKESWSSKGVIVTRADQAQVTTMTTEEGNHKVYPLDMFWELHARL